MTEFGGRRLWIGILLAVISATLEGVGLVLLLPMLAAVGATGSESITPLLSRLSDDLGLTGLLVLWTLVVLALAGFSARREMTMNRLNQHFIGHLRQRLHLALLGMEWSAFQQLRSADAVATLTGGAVRVGQGATFIIQLITLTLLVVVHVSVAAFLSLNVTLLAAAIGIGVVAVQAPQLRHMMRRGRGVEKDLRNIHATITEHLTMMKHAKSHNAEATFAKAFGLEVNALATAIAVVANKQINVRFRQKILAAVILALVVWIAITKFDITGAPLLLLIAVFARLLPTIGQTLYAALRVVEALPAYGEIQTLLRHCAQNAATPAMAGTPIPTGMLRLQGVSYTWPGRTQPALAGIDLDIPTNRTTALIGPSGAGKSTLADLCLGLLSPSHGSVSVGGIALTGPHAPAWRQRVAIVSQDVVMFHDTVRRNLSWANPDASEAELWQVLTLAAADTMVRNLPQGLDSVLGDRGTRLSGGERQRLALARALLRQPVFLVLDEATSHLDHEHEQLIQEALHRLHGRITVLVIAHRLGTIRHADAIAVIDNGRLREYGTWDELNASGGFVAAARLDVQGDLIIG
ncbi:ABC transporter ATP-binding protein [Magnetospirillum gryphiswaldense]|nr:ABC transporter ATP-binding protein [Magnetospirillum gryphiswaldense]